MENKQGRHQAAFPQGPGQPAQPEEQEYAVGHVKQQISHAVKAEVGAEQEMLKNNKKPCDGHPDAGGYLGGPVDKGLQVPSGLFHNKGVLRQVKIVAVGGRVVADRMIDPQGGKNQEKTDGHC